MIVPLAAAAVLAAAAPADGASAPAEAAAQGVSVYPLAFFAPSNPSSALDMVQRVPGFTFQGGESVRGFASAAGNVLIDGQRPTSKALGLDDALRRIPAEQVVRLELIRGGAPGVDMQGRAVLVNVVRSTAAVTDATVTAQTRLYTDGRIRPRGEATWSQRRGRLAMSMGLIAFSEMNAQGGEGTQVRRGPDRRILESGPLSVDQADKQLQFTGDAVLTRVEDTIRLNLSASRSEQGYFERVGVMNAAGAAVADDRSASDFVNKKLEFGGDYERILKGGMTARMLALQTLQWERRDGLQSIRGVGSVVGERSSLGESIARATLSGQAAKATTFEVGGEAAFNFLDAANRRTVGGTPQVLPNANIRVEERRGEAFARVSWRPRAGVTVEAEMRAEASRISQSGDTESARAFFFPKPRLQATLALGPSDQLRVRLEREVGQLNFRDFASSSAIDAGTVNAGNADLTPERNWAAEAALEHRFWGRGAVVLTYTRNWVQDVVDVIPINNTFDAPGNLGPGGRHILNLTLSLPLERLGWRGALVRGSATKRWTEVTDPVTGLTRPISGTLRPSEAQISFSQDLPRLKSSFGVDYISRYDDSFWRINEIRRNVKGVWFSTYWEWRPRKDLAVRAEVANPGFRSRFRYRDVYTGTRAQGRLAYSERRAWELDPYATLRIRKVL